MALSLTADDFREIAKISNGGRTVWYVRTTGNDTTGDGKSPATAYATVGKAITVLANGDLIDVGPGTFTGQADLSAKTDVLLRGTGWSTIISTTTSGQSALILGTDCIAENLKVTAANDGVGISANADRVKVRRVWAVGGTGAGLTGLRVEVADSTFEGITSLNAGGLQIFGSGRVERCFCYATSTTTATGAVVIGLQLSGAGDIGQYEHFYVKDTVGIGYQPDLGTSTGGICVGADIGINGIKTTCVGCSFLAFADTGEYRQNPTVNNRTLKVSGVKNTEHSIIDLIDCDCFGRYGEYITYPQGEPGKSLDIGADGDMTANYRIANSAFSLSKVETFGGNERHLHPPPHNGDIISYGQIDGATSTTVTLGRFESSVTDYYKDRQVIIRALETAGAAAAQARTITAYNGTTKVATVSAAFATTPSAGNGYIIVV